MKSTTFLTFVGDQCGKAEEAIQFYIAIFPNSEINSITKYKDGEPAGTPELVKHGVFTLNGTTYMISENNYNHADLVTSTTDSAHAKIAAMLAKAAAREAESSEILEVDLMNPQHILRTIEQSYTQKYLDSGMNFEIGLTGGKMDTVASAAFCSRYPVNKVWYVRPNKFDPDKFSQGAKATRYFKISEK